MERAKVNQGIDLSAYEDVWVLGEQREGKIQPVTIELMGEGRKLADQLQKKLAVVIPGYKIESEVEKLLHYGADIVYYMSHPLLSSFSTDGYTSAFVQLIQKKKPEIVLVAQRPSAGISDRELLPGLEQVLRQTVQNLRLMQKTEKFCRQGLHSEGTLWPPSSAQRTVRRCLR